MKTKSIILITLLSLFVSQAWAQQGKEYPQYFYFNPLATDADKNGWTVNDGELISPVLDLSSMQNPELFIAERGSYSIPSYYLSEDGETFSTAEIRSVKSDIAGYFTVALSNKVKKIKINYLNISINDFCIREKGNYPNATRHIFHSFSGAAVPSDITGTGLSIDNGQLLFKKAEWQGFNLSDMSNPVLSLYTADPDNWNTTITVTITTPENTVIRTINTGPGGQYTDIRLPNNATKITIETSSDAARLDNLHIAELYYQQIVQQAQPLLYGWLAAEGNEGMSWAYADNTYTLTGTPAVADTKAMLWLPKIQRHRDLNGDLFIMAEIQNPNPAKMHLYFNEQLVNATGTVLLPVPVEGLQVLNFKAVSVDNTPVAITLKNIALVDSRAKAQTDLTQWYSEFSDDSTMQFIQFSNSGGQKFRLIDEKPYAYQQLYDRYPQYSGSTAAKYYPINNDEIADFYAIPQQGQLEIYTGLADGSADKKVFSYDFSNSYNIQTGACDYNSDGLTDFMLENGYVLVQGADGSFTKRKLDLMSREAYELGYANQPATQSNLTKPRFSGVCIGDDMSLPATYVSPVTEPISIVDFDGDGRPDIMNNMSGELLLNVGQDRYIRQQLGGYVLFRDFNGDNVQDYVIYDAKKKITTVYIAQADGTLKSQVLMDNLSMDNQIWLYDYDKDGDVDIILPFSYNASNGAAFLVVMENDGAGNFTMHENSYTQHLQFIACADIDNDGYYDIAAYVQGDNKNIRCLKGNSQYQFTLQTTPLLTLTGDFYTTDFKFSLADINNDGKYELIADGYDAVYSLSGVTPTVNMPPLQPSAPEFVFEPSTGYLKVSWQRGQDNESSAADLTYALRIGTAPGKGDILHASAYADGRRRNLMNGNMGYALDKIIDASGWNLGNYYISVQAIDPMHRGSAFSAPAVFTKTQLPANFILSDENTTSDTLTVSLTTQRDPALQYLWNFDGGQIIGSNADSSVMKLHYMQPGAKRISLQTRNAAGELSPLCERETYLFANKFTPAFSYTPINDYKFSVRAFADLDNNGIPEALTTNGVYQNDGYGNFSKVTKIFNTNLKFADPQLLDYNGDGIVDILDFDAYISNDKTRAYTNSSTLNNFTLPTAPVNLGHTYLPDVDFNNDGKLDFYLPVYNYSLYRSLPTQWLNDGNYTNFTQHSTSSDLLSHGGIIKRDVNGDGWMDLVSLYGTTYAKKVEILLNNGDGTFTEKIIPAPNVTVQNNFYHIFADMNSDGYLDLVTGHLNSNKIYIHLNNKNEDFNQKVEVVIPKEKVEYSTILYAYDFDNNGYLDLVYDCYASGSNDHKFCVLYFDENRNVQFMETDKILNYGEFMADLDGDGVQDFAEYKNNTTVANSRPLPPASIRTTQLDNSLLVEWDVAQDAETPAGLMRYNIGVKKKGASGAGAFVISPLNGLKDEALPVARVVNEFGVNEMYNPYYRTATRMEIPLTALSEGEYEVQIQSMDAWNAPSVFSPVHTVKVKNNPQIKLPAAACAGMAASIEYKGTGLASQRVWNWDGGELQTANGNIYEVIWDTEGNKTITVTVGGVTDTAYLQVRAAINPAINLPALLMVNAPANFDLPAGYTSYSWTSVYNADQFVESIASMIAGDRQPNVIATTQPTISTRTSNPNAAVATFHKAGYYTLKFTFTTPCGEVTAEAQVQVLEAPAPVIDLVTADASTGKNKIAWTVPVGLPNLITGVNIYKEGSRYNDFQLEATLPLSQTSYVDMFSNPNIMASRYRMAWTTPEGSESQPSIAHKGIHLMINKGIGNSWNLFWGQYEGAIIESFKILRGTTPENLTLLQEVSGSNASFSDLTPPAGNVYYAIEYNAVYTPDYAPLNVKKSISAKAEEAPAGRSNVVSVSDAFSVNLATAVTVSVKDAEITPAKPATVAIADITPVTATYQGVNWSITSGASLATIDQYGNIALTGQGNGNVTVKATTIDGSNLSNSKTLVVKNVITSISVRRDRNELTPQQSSTNLYADILPAEMASSEVVWSIAQQNGTFEAHISGNELSVYNISTNGNITVRATTTNGSGMYAEKTITVTQSGTTTVPVTGVSLNKTETTLSINGTEQLTATVLPANATNKEVTWSTSNSNIATVSDGLVTGKAEGTAMITVTTTDGAYAAACTVRVQTANIAVTGMTLNKTATTLLIKSAEQLTATVLPANATNKTVTWSSSNNSIVTVSNGLITGQAEGAATITVTTIDGGYTAACTVNVQATSIAVTGVTLNKTETTLSINGTKQLVATVLPTNATNKNVVWSSSNSNVATVNDGLVTGKAEGTAMITVTTEDGSKTASCAVTVVDNPVTLTAFSLSQGAEITAFRTVSLNHTFSGGAPTHYMASENETFTGAAWQAYNGTGNYYTFVSDQNGVKKVFTKLKNGAGETAARSDEITYKALHPKLSLSAFAINKGASRTASRTVTLNHTVENGIPTLYSVSENAALVGTTWLSYVKTPGFTLSEGNGTKTIYMAVANESDTSGIVSGQIYLDESITVDFHGLTAALYPNPVSDVVNTVVKDGFHGSVDVTVYSMTGERYLSQTFSTPSFTLDLSKCPAGLLLVKLTSGSNYVVKQIVKQ